MASLSLQPPEVTNIINVLNTYLKWKSLNGPPRGYEHYHPSSFGGCLRKAQYQRYAERGYINVQKEATDPRSVRIFDTGHSLHERWAKYFEEIGVLRGVWLCSNNFCRYWSDEGIYIGGPKPDENGQINNLSPREYGKGHRIGFFKPKSCICGCKDFIYKEIRVESKELNFRGHCDQILDFSSFDPDMFKTGNPVDYLFKKEDLPKKPIVLDMKSINSFGFKSKLDKGPSLVYRVQLVIYCNILDLEYGVLIYENKDDSSTKVYKIDRDPDMWKVIQEQAYKMNDMVDSKLLPPPRPLTRDDSECSYCDFKSICHKSAIWDDLDLAKKRSNFYPF